MGFRFIDTHQLANWVDAKRQLPSVVKDLIEATLSELDQNFLCEIPDGSSAEKRGWDVILDTRKIKGIHKLKYGHLIPRGKSRWEIKSAISFQNAKKSANKDFLKKSIPVAGTKKSVNTYVHITNQSWDSPNESKKEWSTKRKQDDQNQYEKEPENQWKQVLLIDGDDLKNWLAYYPTVALRYAKSMGVYIDGDSVETIDDWWNRFVSQIQTPSVNEQVLLVDRENERSELLDKLTPQARGIIRIASLSARESIAFIIAACRGISELENRMLLLNNESAVRASSMAYENKIFIVQPGLQPAVEELAAGNIVLIPIGEYRPKQVDINLGQQSKDDFNNGLVEAGWDETDADSASMSCNSSVSFLPYVRPGQYAQIKDWSELAPVLLPAVFAGRWDEENEADVKVLEMLQIDRSGYAAFHVRLMKASRINHETLFAKHKSLWKCHSNIMLVNVLAPYVSAPFLRQYRSVLHEVFSGSSDVSGILKKGLSESYAIINSEFVN